MEGLIFYWLFWLCWVVTTFFYPKNHPYRLPVSAWILGTIILSDVSLAFLGLEWNGAGLFIIVTIYLYIAQLNRKRVLYFLLSAFILMLLTVCFLFFELFDPVWILIDREWLLAIFVVYGTLLLHSDKNARLLSLLFGMVHGEIFYAFILKRFSFTYSISSLAFLDALAIAATIILVWNGMELFTAHFNKYFQSVEKEKQKYHE